MNNMTCQQCPCRDAVLLLARRIELLAQEIDEQNINRGPLIEGGRTRSGSQVSSVYHTASQSRASNIHQV